MARPRLTEPARRVSRPSVRFTADELARISASAAQAGVTVSAYIRMQTLQGKVVVERINGPSRELMNEMTRIGNNLNQLAFHAHVNGEMPHDFAELRRDFNELANRLIDLL